MTPIEPPQPVVRTYLTGTIRLTQYVEVATDRTLNRSDSLVDIDIRGQSVAEILDTLAAQIAVLQIRSEVPAPKALRPWGSEPLAARLATETTDPAAPAK